MFVKIVKKLDRNTRVPRSVSPEDKERVVVM